MRSKPHCRAAMSISRSTTNIASGRPELRYGRVGAVLLSVAQARKCTCRHVVDAAHDLHALVQRTERDRIRAAVHHVGAAQREEPALGIQRQFRIGGQVARLVVAQECLAAFAGPFHRTADTPRGPGDQRELRIGRAACAEIAADIVHHHPHVVVAQRPAPPPCHAAAAPRRRRRRAAYSCPVAASYCAERRARLHGDAGDALHRGAQPHHVRRRGECRVGRGGVAHRGIEAEIRCGIATRRAARPVRSRVREWITAGKSA